VEQLTQVGVGGIFAILVIREVFNFLQKRKTPNGDNGVQFHRELDTKVNEIKSLTRELHKWHSVTDMEGVPVWYVRKSLEKSIGELATNIKEQTDIIRRVGNELKDLHRDVHDQIDKIQKDHGRDRAKEK
jgi:hypothetical protein